MGMVLFLQDSHLDSLARPRRMERLQADMQLRPKMSHGGFFGVGTRGGPRSPEVDAKNLVNSLVI